MHKEDSFSPFLGHPPTCVECLQKEFSRARAINFLSFTTSEAETILYLRWLCVTFHISGKGEQGEADTGEVFSRQIVK